jgi:DNA topoisomerase I
MGTILNKEYVIEDDQKRLKPTELGMLVTDLLVESFPDVLNVEFTAGMEDELDLIEEGKEHWVTAMRRFWTPFAKDLERAEVEMRDVKREERPTDLVCDRCGKPMVIKWGRRGEFLACSGYPECRNTTNFTRGEDGTIRPVEPELSDRTCDVCGRPMQVRFGRFGKFLGCSGYPECKAVQPLFKPIPTGIKCLVCGEGELYERRSKRGNAFFSCNRYPECTFAAWDQPIMEPCPRCAAPFVTEKVTRRFGTVRRCAREGCGWQARLDEDAGSWVEMAAARPRAAARIRRRGAGTPGDATGAVTEPTVRKTAARKKTGRKKAARLTEAGGQNTVAKPARAASGGRARRASS